MYDQKTHRGRNHFRSYYLKGFTTEKILKRHVKYCFKINVNPMMAMSKKGENFKFKKHKWKIKSPVITCVGFPSILVPKDNGMQNAEKSQTKKYKKHVASSYGNKFVNVDVNGDVKVRDHCHFTGTYRSSTYRDCNINIKLNHRIPIVFYNLNNYDSHFITQKIDKFNLKINVIPNELRKIYELYHQQ